MLALFQAAVLKLRYRTASWIVLGLLIVMMALVFLGLGASFSQIPSTQARVQVRLLLAFPNAYVVLVGIILSFGGLLALTYGAAVIGADWAWGTIRAVIGRGESRVRYTLVTFAAVTAALGSGLLICFTIGAFLAIVAAGMAGISSDGATDPETLATLPELLGRTWLGITQQAAIGFAIAMLFRSQLAAIGAGLALYFAELFLIIVPLARDALPYFPFNVAQAVVSTAEGLGPSTGPGATRALDSATAVVLAFVYLFAALAIASVAVWRAQITE